MRRIIWLIQLSLLSNMAFLSAEAGVSVIELHLELFVECDEEDGSGFFPPGTFITYRLFGNSRVVTLDAADVGRRHTLNLEIVDCSSGELIAAGGADVTPVAAGQILSQVVQGLNTSSFGDGHGLGYSNLFGSFPPVEGLDITPCLYCY